MKTELATALQGVPVEDVRRMARALYDQLVAKVKAGTATQEDIRAVNMARKVNKEN